MNRRTATAAIGLGISATALVATWIYDRKWTTKHNERMVNLARETQNIRDAREATNTLLTELDRKIEAGKFWLIVTEED